MRPVALVTLLIGLLLAVAVPALAGEVRWQGWDAGLSSARANKRYILVDVYTDWCGWCKRMDKDVYAREDVSDYLNKRFTSVKLNAESNQAMSYQGEARTARGIAGGFHVNSYPTTIFLTAEGEHLTNVPGYVPADRFLLLLRFIGDGHMEKGVSWAEYVARAGAAK
ncbi:MAG: thioredoxin fold domain-containing protein [Candidatus Eisenbacteria bacterium]